MQRFLLIYTILGEWCFSLTLPKQHFQDRQQTQSRVLASHISMNFKRKQTYFQLHMFGKKLIKTISFFIFSKTKQKLQKIKTKTEQCLLTETKSTSWISVNIEQTKNTTKKSRRMFSPKALQILYAINKSNIITVMNYVNIKWCLCLAFGLSTWCFNQTSQIPYHHQTPLLPLLSFLPSFPPPLFHRQLREQQQLRQQHLPSQHHQ